MMKRGLLLILALTLVLGLNACGNSSDKTNKNNKTDQSSEKDTDAQITERIGDRIFSYTGEPLDPNFDDDVFQIALMEDGSFSYYESMLSSHIGFGTWLVEDGILILTESPDSSHGATYRFKVDGNKLYFIQEGSDNFIYIQVKDGEKFTSNRLKEDEKDDYFWIGNFPGTNEGAGESTPESESTSENAADTGNGANDQTESVTEPENTTEPETETESDNTTEPEDATAPETVTFPEDAAAPEPTPEEVAAAAEAEKAANILSCMNATFSGALDHLVPEKKLDGASKVSNAILLNTTYSISSADETSCTVTVRYPNVAAALTEALSTLPAEATEEQTNEMLENLAAKIENQEVEMLEKTYTAEVIQADGMYTIKWTTELFDAFTGGLYSIE